MKENGKKVMPENARQENIWTDECEALLAEWSEKASCYRWLHGRSEKNYRTWYYCFSIPVIILSTLTGAANVGMDSFVPAESKSMASAIVGGVNIFAGIISTLQNFLKVAELMEGHRIAGVSWGKLQRNIAIELALDPSRRVLQGDFLKLARAEYDRLIEAGPLIDDGIIGSFNKKFKNYDVSVPSICNGLDKCKIYKIDPNLKPNEEDFMDGIEDLVSEEEKALENKLKETIVESSIIDSESNKDDSSTLYSESNKDDSSIIDSESNKDNIQTLINEDNKDESTTLLKDDKETIIPPKENETKKCSCDTDDNKELKKEDEELKKEDEELKKEDEENNNITDFLDGIK